MSNIYCSSCGTKHILGSKFCTNCGNSLGGFANISKPVQQKNTLTRRNTPVESVEEDEDGIPTSFRKPARLSYEIEKTNNKYSAKDLLNSAPLNDNEKSPKRVVNYRKLSKEEFLSQSMKECSSRPIQDIDES